MLLVIRCISFVINHNRFTDLISDVISNNHRVKSHFTFRLFAAAAVCRVGIYANFRNLVLEKKISLEVALKELQDLQDNANFRHDIYGEGFIIGAAIDQ